MRTVAVIDDDEVERLGRRLVLESAGHRCWALPWLAVNASAAPWSEVDLVLVSVRPDGAHWDHYSSVGRLEQVRDLVGPRCRIAAVVRTDVMTNPLMGIRLHEAGVTEVLHRSQVGGRMGLDSAADGRTPGRAPLPPPQVLDRLRVGPRSDPGAVVALIVKLGQRDESYFRAFAPGYRQNECGLSRRRAHTLRVQISRLGDLRPDPARSMGGPERDRSLPHWSEVVAFVNLCRGWDAVAEVSDLDDWRPVGRGRSASMPSLASAGAPPS